MKSILILLLLLLIPLAQAEPLATSYWGYVSVDNTPKANALVTVLDSSGKEVAHATSSQDSTYQVTVPWDDSTTQANEGVADGETISFKVDGNTVLSRQIDLKGSNNRLDLAVTSSQSPVSSGAVTSSTATSNTAVSNTATTTSINTSSPAATTTSEAAASPTATLDGMAATTEKTETPASEAAKGAPGFGVVLAVAGLMMVILRRG